MEGNPTDGKLMNVYFIDEHDSSKQNGIGTFRDTLLPLLSKYDDLAINLVSLNSDSLELLIHERDFGTEYQLPSIENGNWRDNGELIMEMMQAHISEGCNNLFILNHSPCAPFIDVIKKFNPASKVIFIIHDQGWCEPLFGDSRLLAMIERGKCPSIVSQRTFTYVSDYCRKEREIYERADKIVCLSDSTERILSEIYKVPRNKTVKIYNGYGGFEMKRVSRTQARKRLGVSEDDELIMFVARPVRYKGIEPLLYALRSLRKTHPKVRCVLAGSMRGFMGFQNLEKPVASNLIFAGFLDRKELSLWYAAADVGVMSSYSEQCSFAALEMMKSGVTVVSSNGNGLCDMFHDGINARVADVGSVVNMESYGKRLAKGIADALEMPESDRNALLANNRHLLCTKYSPRKMAENYYNLIMSLAGFTL